ncbi:MAG: GDSL-type esterase/lipase family protein [bacterium]
MNFIFTEKKMSKNLVISLIITTILCIGGKNISAQTQNTDTDTISVDSLKLLLDPSFIQIDTLAPCTLPLQQQLPYYNCVNYDKNRFIFPGDSSKFNILYEKLDSLALYGDAKINIVHIGGSHVQADIMSNRIRMNLIDAEQGFQSDRGAIFPFKAAKTNNPFNYSIEYSGEWVKSQNSLPPLKYSVGMMGISVTTSERDAYISFDLNSGRYETNWEYNKLKLFADISTEEYSPMLIIDGDSVPSNIEDDYFVFNLPYFANNGLIIITDSATNNSLISKYLNKIEVNDSIIAVIDSVNMHNDSILCDTIAYDETLEIGLESDNTIAVVSDSVVDIIADSIIDKNIEIKEERVYSDFTFTLMGLLPENDFNGITYHSLGVNGASLSSWLRSSEFSKQIENIKPDLVILAVGVNDANVPYGQFSSYQYKENYTSLLQSIYATNPNCAVIFITNNDCDLRVGRYSKGVNRNTALVQTATYEIAEQEGAAVWDLYDIMGGYGSMGLWKNAGLANRDHVHFLLPGYNLLGDMLYNALIFDWLYKIKR